MGDITIHFLVDSALAADEAEASEASAATEASAKEEFRFRSLSRVLPGDASLAELMDFVLTQIATAGPSSNGAAKSAAASVGEGGWLNKLAVLDVSYHPAKIISPTVRRFTERAGPNSKTLQSMGWYPSGKLVVLPSPSSLKQSPSSGGSEEKPGGGEEELLEKFLEWQSRNLARYEEFAYNNPDAANEGRSRTNDDATDGRGGAKGGVQWTGLGASAQGAALKPSEIFNAVEQRSDGMEVEAASKPKPKKKPQRTERERTQRLDTLLQKVETKSGNKKKKAVSEKVRTMLLKSRSEGNKKLRMEDRFHLEVVCVWDVADGGDAGNDGSGTSYRFFSRQSTAGRVASTVAPSLGNERAAEFLVHYPPSADTKEGERRYRRLPNTMSLHDAQNAGWLKEFDAVVVRIYDLKGSGEDGAFGASKPVTDPESDDEAMDEEDGNDATERAAGNKEGEAQSAMEVDEGTSNDKPANDDGEPIRMQEESQKMLQQRIHAAFQAADESNNQSKNKKTKPVSQQVRKMLMKSKSTGNKRIKQEDRLYLEVIVFRDDGSSDIGAASCASSYRFFTKQNDVEHIISTCIDDANAKAECIVSRNTNDTDVEFAYRKLPFELTLGDAIQKGHVDNLGRIMIRVMGNDNCLSCESAECDKKL